MPTADQLLTITETLLDADADEGISTDELMNASGLTPEGVRGALHDLERLGIASNDTALTAFVHAGVRRTSRRRFLEAEELEQGFIDLLRETAPDMRSGDTSMLHLRHATQRLRDDGHVHALPERLRRYSPQPRRRRPRRGRRRRKPSVCAGGTPKPSR